MPPVDPIPLSSVRTFTKLSAAPMGTLLQVASIRAGTPHAAQVFAVVGMHCEQRTDDERTTRGLLLLEGDDAGLLVTGLHDQPAIDLSDVAEVALTNAAPRAAGQGAAIKVGDVCHVTMQGEELLCLATGSSATPTGYTRLTGTNAGHAASAQEQVLTSGG